MVLTAILSLGLVLCILPLLVLSQSSCVTPARAAGQCIRYQECPFVQKIIGIYGRNIPRRIHNQITQMECKSTTNTREFHLCCPNEATPQSNQESQRKVVRSEGGNLNRYDQRGLQLLDRVSNCGNKGNPKVSGGKTAKPGDFPWVALLKYKINDQRPFLCGGSLISERHILTAAHCIVDQPEVIAVRLGEHDLDTEEDCHYLGGINRVCLPPYEEYGIEKIHVHPNYVHGEISFDVAIIKLDRVVKEKSHIKPVCLPIDRRSQELAYDQSFFVAGWGGTEKATVASKLQQALITRKNLDECRQYYNKGEVNDNHICATGTGIKHTCQGDSGGPVFFKHQFKNTYRVVQYGVVSFGGKLCGRNNNQPGIFASVIDMLPWITQNLQ
ncbi:serine protease grass [Drosophila eugracilis]|uniref:serine protease grass n=1 Tax=Drosophila eugracilis TaxID=29029 RepID=UPI001BDA5D68|nr:serine protease grass [Drosophila eugracilis]XP_041674705.1 serine protease grass [Drosophila eugracilis]